MLGGWELGRHSIGPWRAVLGIMVISACLLPGVGAAQCRPTKPPDPEKLLFMDVETPTRRPLPIIRSPAAVSVITAEDIRLSGLTTVPDLLRYVPGMDVFRVSVSDVNVNGRGFNGRATNRLQVFIDGRYLHEDIFNLVFWEQLPISLEEIERIEVITSPASALYGTNAFSGVVQIFTKSPEALCGTHVIARGGSADTFIGTLMHADVRGPVGYKFVFEYDQANNYPNPAFGRTDDQLGLQDYRGSGLVEYRPDSETLISISGGADGFDRDIDPGFGSSAQPGLGLIFANGSNGYAMAKFTRGDFKAQVAYNRLDTDLESGLFPQAGRAVFDTIQTDLQQSLTLGEHVLTGGFSYRFVRADAPVLIGSEVQDENLFAGFLQDEFSPHPDLTFTGVFRVDSHPYAGVNISPRASVVYVPWRDHSFRASFGSAFRNPSIVENFMSLSVPTGMPSPPSLTVSGNPNLVAEEMFSYEVGYRGRLFAEPPLWVTLNLFYNDFDRFIQLAPSGPDSFTFQNLRGGYGYGGEVGVEVFPTTWLRTFVNYSYQQMQADPVVLGVVPNNKVNVGLFVTLPNGISATLLFRYVGGSEALSLPFPAGSVPLRADAYTQVDARVAYRFFLFGADTEIAVSATNLFNDSHQSIAGGDTIDRRILGWLRVWVK